MLKGIIMNKTTATLRWRHHAGSATPDPTGLPAAVLQGRPGQESLPARLPTLLWQLYPERCRNWKTDLNWRIIEISFSIDRDKRCAPCCDSKHPDQHHLLILLLRHTFLLFDNRNQDLPRPESFVEDWPKNWGALKYATIVARIGWKRFQKKGWTLYSIFPCSLDVDDDSLHSWAITNQMEYNVWADDLSPAPTHSTCFPSLSAMHRRSSCCFVSDDHVW